MNDIVSTNWNYPTPIWFGLSRRLEIIEALNELSITKPMIVTDPNFAENENFIDILAILKKSQFEFSVFSNIKGNPTGKNVADGVHQFNSRNSDGIIIIIPPIRVNVEGTSLTPKRGIQHHMTPPTTSVRERSMNSAAGK